MTIPVSTVPAVKTALVAGITAAVNDVEVNVTYDEAGTWQPDDIITVGDVARTIIDGALVGSGGAGWLKEEYTVDVTVSCFTGDDDAPTVAARARTLTALVESFVRGDPSIGGLVLVSYPSGSDESGRWDDAGKGRFYEIVTHIYCFAQI